MVLAAKGVSMGSSIANEAYVFTETDKTKSKWVARVYQDFLRRTGRPKTTLRGLFYHALQMKDSEYPICGGFVGEIRIMRPYHEQDGLKLLKWARKSKAMGFVSPGAIIEETSGEGSFLPADMQANDRTDGQMRSAPATEVWLNKPSLSSLLIPICKKHGIALIWFDGRPSKEAVASLFARACAQTTILTLSDLSPKDAFFAQDLADLIDGSRPVGHSASIEVKSIGLVPDQIGLLKIPLVHGNRGQREEEERYERYLKKCSLDPRKVAELDALEVYYPGGVAAYLVDALSRYLHGDI